MLHVLRLKFLRLRALVRKELVTLLLDPAMLRILFVPVIAQSVLFGYGATFNLERVPYVLYDASRSEASFEVARKIESNGIFEPIATPQSIEDVRRTIDHGDALIGIVIPDDFAARQADGTGGTIYVAVDARNTTTANVATGYVAAIVENLNAEKGAAGAVRLVERYRYNENAITRYNIMPGLILALSMLQVMLLAGVAVSREREEGSFDMMLMTPMTPVEIFVGKAVPPLVIGIAQGFLIFAVARYWFEIPFAGSIGLLFFVVSLFSLSIVGLALAISAASRTYQQSVILVFFFVLPALILSGLMTPVGAMPEFMQAATVLNPARYGIQMVRMIYFEGADFDAIRPFLWPLLLLTGLSIPAATWFFRHKVT